MELILINHQFQVIWIFDPPQANVHLINLHPIENESVVNAGEIQLFLGIHYVNSFEFVSTEPNVSYPFHLQIWNIFKEGDALWGVYLVHDNLVNQANS